MTDEYQDDEGLRRHAVRRFEAGDHAGARRLLEQICARKPDDTEFRSRLAYSCLQLNDAPAAEQHLRVAVQQAPTDPLPAYWLAVAVARLGRNNEARALFEEALVLGPEIAEAHNDLGHVLRTLGEHDAAERHFLRATEIRPDFIAPLYNLGLSSAQKGDLDAAEAWYRRVLELQPGHFESLNNLANVLRHRNRLDEAVDCYRRAVEVNQDSAPAWASLAHTLENLHRLDEAVQAAGRALQIDPLNPVAALVSAQASRRTGDPERARRYLEPLVFSGLPAHESAAVNSELGHIFDRLGDYSSAFDAWTRGNDAWLAALGPERSADTSYVDHVRRMQTWVSAERFSSWPRAIDGSELEPPVFLLGFPRSGTTLLEQMLAAHSGYVVSREQPVLNRLINELSGPGQDYLPLLEAMSDSDVISWRDRYRELASAAVPAGSSGKVFVDKLPLNIVELGLIRRLFPDARILVMLRDPRAVVLSAFAQAFQPNRAMVHYLALESTAKLYALVMDLWMQYRKLDGLQYMEVHYEDLVVDQTSVMQAVFRFLGSGWEAAVEDYHQSAREHYARTPSYQDVTRPVYRQALERWRNYRDRLAPVLPLLEKYVSAFGYQMQ